MEPLLNYALDENGVPIHVDNVPNGKACGCHCPCCEKPLSARQGQKRQHHFAHIGDYNCKGAYETMLHILAKKVLSEAGQIMLPSNAQAGFPVGLVKLYDVHCEQWDEQYHIRPDVEAITEDGERLLIEFLVSHKVDGRKRQVIIDNNLKCIELNLNYQLLDENELREFLTNSHEDREWVEPVKNKLNYTKSSGPYSRNPIYGQIRDMLKDIYNEETIRFHPYQSSKNQCVIDNNEMVLDLKEMGYDVCNVHYSFRGLRHGLLFSKSTEDTKKHTISVNIRGRRRRQGFKAPKGMLIIDIVLKFGTAGNDASAFSLEADIYKTNELKCYGFQEWSRREGLSNYYENHIFV